MSEQVQPDPAEQVPRPASSVPEQPQPPEQRPSPLTPAPDPVSTGLAMKERHPVLVWLAWPLITLGIYRLVWYYKIHREMADFDPRRTIPVVGPMLVVLLLGWTIVAPLISFYNCGERIREAQRAAGLRPECSPVIGTLLMFVFTAGVLYYQMELNKITESYGVPEGSQVPLYA